MEDTLREKQKSLIKAFNDVLILVLMEDTLRAAVVQATAAFNIKS